MGGPACLAAPRPLAKLEGLGVGGGGTGDHVSPVIRSYIPRRWQSSSYNSMIWSPPSAATAWDPFQWKPGAVPLTSTNLVLLLFAPI